VAPRRSSVQRWISTRIKQEQEEELSEGEGEGREKRENAFRGGKKGGRQCLNSRKLSSPSLNFFTYQEKGGENRPGHIKKEER